jgi:hypothetical protein
MSSLTSRPFSIRPALLKLAAGLSEESRSFSTIEHYLIWPLKYRKKTLRGELNRDYLCERWLASLSRFNRLITGVDPTSKKRISHRDRPAKAFESKPIANVFTLRLKGTAHNEESGDI